MKILKIALIGIVGIVALVLVIALFIKQDYAVEREVVINKQKDEVFNYIKYLKNQDSFSVWANRDPKMKKEYRGTDATVGFVSAWESKSDSVGKGEQEIKGIKEGERVDYELRFIEPFESTDNAYMTTEKIDENQTKVKWGFNGKMKYPMNLMCIFVDMDAMLGKDLKQGLDNLKANLEKK
jgi:hypothetical protein